MARRNRAAGVTLAKMTGAGQTTKVYEDRSPRPTLVYIAHGPSGSTLVLTMNPDGHFELAWESGLGSSVECTPLIAGYVRDDHLEVHELAEVMAGTFHHEREGQVVYEAPAPLRGPATVRGVKRIEFEPAERGEASRANWGQD